MLRIIIATVVIMADSALMAQLQNPPVAIQTADTPKPPVPDDLDRSKVRPLKPLPELLKKELKDATPLNPDGTVFLDPKSKRVVLRTEVACRSCILEMLLVPEGNREHETILRIRSKAFVIHTAILALGLEPGKPAVFSPEFVPPSGSEIDMELVWLDEKGETHRANACDWIRHNVHRYYVAPLAGPPAGIQFPYKNLRWDKFNNELLWYGPMTEEERNDLLTISKNEEYQKAIEQFFKQGQSRPMKAAFVFVGSSMYKDEETGQEFYQAEDGHLICMSNFPDAMIDIREQSSASDGGQTYEAWTERIPPDGTPVLLILKPHGVAAAKGTAND